MKQKRIKLELVTPHNKAAFDRTRHEVLSDPQRFAQFGEFAQFEVTLKNDYNTLWFVVVTDDRKRDIIGFCEVERFHNSDVAGIALGLVPSWRGKGYGPIVGRMLNRYCFETLGVHKVESVAMSSNPASVHMQTVKGGMKEEGRRRQSVKVGDQFYDKIMFGLLRSEWEDQVNARAYKRRIRRVAL